MVFRGINFWPSFFSLILSLCISFPAKAEEADPKISASEVTTALPFQELEERIFEQQRERLSKRDFEEFVEWYHAQFAFDRRETFLDQLRAPLSNKTGVIHRYNQDREHALDGYLAARKYLFSIPISEITIEHLLHTQKLLLSSKSVGRITAKIRHEEAPLAGPSNRIPKLPFWSLDRTRKFGKSVRTKTALARVNPFIASLGTRWFHAPLASWPKYAEFLSPELKMKLAELDETLAHSDPASPRLHTARQKMLREIWKFKLDVLKRSAVSSNTSDELVRAVADYTYDMLSAHVLPNENGPLDRLIAERFLTSVGRPLWLEWGYDFMLPKEEYLKHLKDSIELGEVFVHDLLNRTLEKDFYAATSAHWTHDLADVARPEPEILESFALWPISSDRRKLRTFNSALLDFSSYAKIPPYDSAFPKSAEVEPRRLRPASPAFIASFGILSKSESDWKKKIKDFYDPSALIHRGAPWEYHPTSREIIDTFIKPEFTLTGMGLDPTKILATKRSVFHRFNQMLFDDRNRLEKLLYEHTNGIGEWATSGLTSFSVSAQVARRFSIEDHANNEIDSIRTATLVSVRPRKVAAVRTYQALPHGHPAFHFSSEREIVAYGGTDPESIMSIEYVDVRYDAPTFAFWLTGRIRRVERTAYNQFTIKEYAAPNERYSFQAGPSAMTLVREELWTITPNHRPKRISSHQFQPFPPDAPCNQNLRELAHDF